MSAHDDYNYYSNLAREKEYEYSALQWKIKQLQEECSKGKAAVNRKLEQLQELKQQIKQAEESFSQLKHKIKEAEEEAIYWKKKAAEEKARYESMRTKNAAMEAGNAQ